jgi:hypothetical protein
MGGNRSWRSGHKSHFDSRQGAVQFRVGEVDRVGGDVGVPEAVVEDCPAFPVGVYMGEVADTVEQVLALVVGEIVDVEGYCLGELAVFFCVAGDGADVEVAQTQLGNNGRDYGLM